MPPSALPAEAQWICRCLRVTKEELHQAIDQGQVDSIEDVFAATGAGQGCTACHLRIRRVLDSHQQPAEM